MKIRLPRPRGWDWVGFGVIGLIVATLATLGVVTWVNSISARAAADANPSPSTSWAADPGFVFEPITDPDYLPLGPPVDEELIARIQELLNTSDPSTENGGETAPGDENTPTGEPTDLPSSSPLPTSTTTPPPSPLPTSTTTPPPPTFEPWETNEYYEGSSSQFCLALDSARQGAGADPFASCSRSSTLVSHAEAMARANDVWHSGSDNIVGTDYSITALVNAFMASSGHRAQIVGDGSAATATVGCFWWKREYQTAEDFPVITRTRIFCAGAFVYP